MQSPSPPTSQEVSREVQRFGVWAGFAICFFIAMALYFNAQRREKRHEEWKRREIVIVRGTVLRADCSFDPTNAGSGTVKCENLLVVFPLGPPGSDKENEETTQSFTSSFDLENIDSVPQIGNQVLVSWNKNTPKDRLVMPMRK